MKKLLLAVLLISSSATQAAPTLVVAGYPTTGPVPDSATFTINGGTPIACTIATVSNAVQAQCDLASITTAGTYTLIATPCAKGGIQNTPTGAINVQAGCAPSNPFSYQLIKGLATTPTLTVAP